MIDLIELESNNRKVVADYYHNGNNRSAMVLLHGFLSSKESMSGIADELLKSGFDSIAIDYNGHGDSEGDFSEFTISRAIDDCRSAHVFLSSNGYEKIGILGFSIGGYVALNYTKKHSGVDTLVLCAPLSSFSQIFGNADLPEWKKTNMFNSEHLGLSIRLNYDFYEDGMSYDGYDTYTSINVPVLILHGVADDVVPILHSEMLLKSLKNAYLFRLNSNHSIFSNKSYNEAIDAILKWLRTYLK
ncbi:MAG: alpha/beta hydrolase [Candidatus Micrarchaeia archaeon]